MPLHERVALLNTQLVSTVQELPTCTQGGPGHEMTFADRRRLSIRLSRLGSSDALLGALHSVCAADPAYAHADGDVMLALDDLKVSGRSRVVRTGGHNCFWRTLLCMPCMKQPCGCLLCQAFCFPPILSSAVPALFLQAATLWKLQQLLDAPRGGFGSKATSAAAPQRPSTSWPAAAAEVPASGMSEAADLEQNYSVQSGVRAYGKMMD